MVTGNPLSRYARQNYAEARPRSRVATKIAEPLFADLCAIFRVGHMLHPCRVVSVERFLHRDMGHPVGRRAAMPVFFARRNPDDVASANFAHRLSQGLNPADARDDVERLAERVRMPR